MNDASIRETKINIMLDSSQSLKNESNNQTKNEENAED